MIPKIVFCPKCRRPFKIEKKILDILEHVQVKNGVKIACPFKEAKSNKKCTGSVKIKIEKFGNGGEVMTINADFQP